ncbi:MAG: hypothetical protein ISQ61_01920 [SAR86 cluster bacterium]|uniref:Lipid A biosynthesis acyltransferase n=1 Tax=SAR86 cluster bacterium TaxID=2030880 RepID=A0A937LN27_9GAMM|nr:hypothetical protein [SAR86 cluster bacterium]
MFLILFKLFSIFPLFLLKAIASLFAQFLIIFSLSPYRITKKNINYCGFKNKKLARNSINMTAETFLEYPYIWGNPRNYHKLLEHNEELHQISQSDKPSLIFTLHMGCVDVMLFHSSYNLPNLNIIYTPAKNKNFEDTVRKIRQSMAAKLHTANVSGMKELYKNYLNGENVIVACDLVPHHKGTYSKLFNKPCFSIDLIEKLSKKDTHNLHFVYLTHGNNKKYKFNLETINRPISTDEMNNFFEKAITEAPDLYGWEYKKFRKLQGEVKNIY